ncbi:hypothetical protein WA577_004056, partial [Blastocystis sp. JDR]
MSDAAADKLKEKGNACLKDRDYDGAIRFYNEAIEFAPYNPKLYSNRCTARLLLHQFEDALKDAEKCVSLDPDWAKGHIQMGSCYAGMGKYAEAKRHYAKALPLSDTKETVEKLIKDMDVKESENSFTGFLFGNSLKALETLENVIRVLLIVCWVVAALPFGGASLKMRMSSFFATCFSCLLLIHIYRTYGRPRWSRDYWLPIARDALVCYALPVFLFRSTVFASFPMVIVILHELLPLCLFVYSALSRRWSPLAERLRGSVDRAMVKALGNDASWYTRTPSEKQYIANETLGFAAASFEVMLIPFALGNLLRGLRGLPTVLLTFEYVMYRVAVDPIVARAVQLYDTQINRWMYHPRCPAFLRNAYFAVRGYITQMFNRMYRR